MSSTNCCNFSHPASITLAYDMPVGTIGILLYLFITTLWNRVVIPALWGKGWEHFRDLPCSPSQQVSYLNSPLNALFWHPSFWKPDTRTSTQRHLVCPDTTMSGGLTWSPDTLCVVPPQMERALYLPLWQWGKPVPGPGNKRHQSVTILFILKGTVIRRT